MNTRKTSLLSILVLGSALFACSSPDDKGAAGGGGHAAAPDDKPLVLEALDAIVVAKQGAKAIETYFDPGYIQHNPHTPTGTAPLEQFASDLAGNEDFKYERFRAIAGEHLVVTQSRFTNLFPGKP